MSKLIDTASAGGRLVFHLMGALAKFERALIVERTKAGLKLPRVAASILADASP
ncbi:e14 prophage; site-specific DNA recombinase (fragment) [uncultured Gammaproteobacteria bacterium]